MDNRRAMGDVGEMMAMNYLVDHGYQVVAKQWKSEFGEIDLVCLDPQGEVIFVEVKTRESLESGYPEESVTPAKLKHLENAADCFLQERAWEAKEYRFDVIAIIIHPMGAPEIIHLQGV